MTLYYCINDVLDKLDKQEDKENRLQALIPVTEILPECNGYSEDTFALSSIPKLLDLRRPEEKIQFASLLDEVPLYNINMELILDEALSERHKNSRVEHALNQAFGNKPLPNTLKSGKGRDEDLSGNLQHPMLGHLDKTELCELYMTFLKHLDRDHDIYGFERNVLGKHADKFLSRFDGFATNHDAKVKAQILIAFGMRQDHDPAKPMESYVDEGKKKASKMGVTEQRELVWAWLEAENYQMRRCRDLDRIMKIDDLPKTPNWVRTDIFCCLEKEAMKQFFANELCQHDPELEFLREAPGLQRAIMLNSRDEVDEALQKLLSQILGQNGIYSGTAGKFAENAEKRIKEAKVIAI